MFVGHTVHGRDIEKALRQSGAAIEATGRAMHMLNGAQGFRGSFEGVGMAFTNNVSETGSAKIGVMMGTDVLRYGVWNPTTVLYQEAIENLAGKLVTWKRSGFTLATNGEDSTGADSSIVKVLCKNT